MTNPNRHPPVRFKAPLDFYNYSIHSMRQVITRPEFMGRVVHTSTTGLTNSERLDLYVAKLSNRNPTGTHRQNVDTRPLWFRSLSILGAAIGGGAFLAVVFAAVYFLEI